MSLDYHEIAPYVGYAVIGGAVGFFAISVLLLIRLLINRVCTMLQFRFWLKFYLLNGYHNLSSNWLHFAKMQYCHRKIRGKFDDRVACLAYYKILERNNSLHLIEEE